MRISSLPFIRHIAVCMVLMVAAQTMEAAAQTGDGSAAAQAQSATPNQIQKDDSGVAGKDASAGIAAPAPAPTVNAAPASPAANDSPEGQSAAEGSQMSGTDSASGQQQNQQAKPVGTAVAPAANTTGIAGSRLTGAVIAPAKQRRVRAILISVGVVVGACVAVGIVAALSHSSSSQPQMSH
jgi:hypothetical protein